MVTGSNQTINKIFSWFWILPDVRQRIPVEIAMSFFLSKGKHRAILCKIYTGPIIRPMIPAFV